MAGSTEAASRLNFNPDWMPSGGISGGGGPKPTVKCPSFSSSVSTQQQINDTILAPPILSKNRYSREELLALFNSIMPAPDRLKDDFPDFYIDPPRNPVCMTSYTEMEQQVFMQGGINSSKVINVVNQVERYGSGAGGLMHSVPPGAGMASKWAAGARGFGRGAGGGDTLMQSDGFGSGGGMRGQRGMSRGAGFGRTVSNSDQFPSGLGRGRGEGTAAGIRPGPPSRAAGSELRENSAAPIQHNPRAQGLYDPNNPKDRPRQRLKSTGKADELEETPHPPYYKNQPTSSSSSHHYHSSSGSSSKYTTVHHGSHNSGRSGHVSAAAAASLPEWAQDEDEEEEDEGQLHGQGRPEVREERKAPKLVKTGSFDETGNFRRAPDKKVDDDQEKLTKNDYTHQAANAQQPPQTSRNDPTTLPDVARRVPHTFLSAPVRADDRTPSSILAAPQEPQRAPLSHIQAAGSAVDAAGAARLLAAPTQEPMPSRSAEAARLLQAPRTSSSNAITPTSSTRAAASSKTSSEDDVLSDLHARAENVVKSVFTEESDTASSRSLRTASSSFANGSSMEHVQQHHHEPLVYTNTALQHQQQQQQSAIQKIESYPPNTQWFYKDLDNNCQGPFPSDKMALWFAGGYLTMQLMVRPSFDPNFVSLGDIITRLGCLPFSSSSPSVSGAVASQGTQLTGQDPYNIGQQQQLLQQQQQQQNVFHMAAAVGGPPGQQGHRQPVSADLRPGFSCNTGALDMYQPSNITINNSIAGQQQPTTIWDVYNNPSTNNFGSIVAGIPSLNNKENNNSTTNTLVNNNANGVGVSYNKSSDNLVERNSRSVIQQPQLPSSVQQVEQELHAMLEQLKMEAMNRRQAEERQISMQEEIKRQLEEERKILAENQLKLQRENEAHEQRMKEAEQQLKARLELKKEQERAWLEEKMRCDLQQQQQQQCMARSSAGFVNQSRLEPSPPPPPSSTNARVTSTFDAPCRSADVQAWLSSASSTNRSHSSAQVDTAATNKKVQSEKNLPEEEHKRRRENDERQREEAQRTKKEELQRLEEERRLKEEEEKKRLYKERRERELKEQHRKLVEEERRKNKKLVPSSDGGVAWGRPTRPLHTTISTSGAQSLKEIQQEEERQMLAEKRQQLEFDVMKKEALTATATPVGAWSRGSSSLVLTAPQHRSSSPPASGPHQPFRSSQLASAPRSNTTTTKNPWTTSQSATSKFPGRSRASDSMTDDDATAGFWDDEPFERNPELSAASVTKAATIAKTTIVKNSSLLQQSTKRQEQNKSRRNQSDNSEQHRKSDSQNVVKRYLENTRPVGDEFSTWCVKQVKKMNKEIDETEATVFIEFLRNVPDIEVNDYVLGYIPDSEACRRFLEEFIEKRTLLAKNNSGSASEWLVVNKQQSNHGSNSGDNRTQNNQQQQQRGASKRKGKKTGGVLDHTMLGFKPAGDPNRLNIGEIDSPT